MKKKISKSSDIWFFVVAPPVGLIAIIVLCIYYHEIYVREIAMAIITFFIGVVIFIYGKKNEMFSPMYYDEQGIYYKDKQITWENLYINIYIYPTKKTILAGDMLFCEKEIDSFNEYKELLKKHFWKELNNKVDFLCYYKKPIYVFYYKENKFARNGDKYFLRFYKKLKNFEIKEKILYDI